MEKASAAVMISMLAPFVADDAAWTTIVVLAVVQGITEFLPVSSSGHLVILGDLLGRNLEIADLNIVLHLGTLGSILVYYRRRLWRLLGEDRGTLQLLVVATIPAVVLGVPVKLWASDALLENPWLAGLLLPVTGLVLWWGSRHADQGGRYQELTITRATWIGWAQALAILPGLSRSGLTISAGMRLGLSPASATVFSFLMAVAAIGGAGVLEAVSMFRKGGLATPWPLLAGGACLSFLTGLASLWLLDHVIRRGRLVVFAYWCVPAGLLYLGWRLLTT